ncbi:hypothetical protein [Solitalea lacus]|uniref:hypothetical protein n=1 Tax=Solitalea lacus TaxID=2911172 RepID=UPI001EDC2104|nr:hypothetical protein [Solitalea lacus]UKJ06617.1 hypothetical protein L2B55_13895 [Solitalea lacus]
MLFEYRGDMKVKGDFLVVATFIFMFFLNIGEVGAQQKTNPKTPVTKKSTVTKSTIKKTVVPDSVKKAVKKAEKDTTLLSNQVIGDSLAIAQTKVLPAKSTTTGTAKGKTTTKPADPKSKTAATTAKNANTKVKVAPDLIKTNSIGVLRLGMAIDTIKKIFPKERVYRVYVYDAKDKYEQYQVTATDKVSQFLLINPECDGDSICIIRQIVAKSPYFKTDRNISVGMTLDDLVLAYGFLDSRWEEENLIVRNREGIDFVMDTSDIPKRWYRKMNLDRLPLPTRIIGIMITSKTPPVKW